RPGAGRRRPDPPDIRRPQPGAGGQGRCRLRPDGHLQRARDPAAQRRGDPMTWAGLTVAAIAVAGAAAAAQPPERSPLPSAERAALDARAQQFLDRKRNQWHDLNVPYEDGRVLHDLIVSKGLKRGLEIGTSTGHSGVWIAWAMSRTGGRLITI